MDILWVIMEVIVIILLVIECWLLWFFAAEHSLFLDIIKHNLIEIKKRIKDQSE